MTLTPNIHPDLELRLEHPSEAASLMPMARVGNFEPVAIDGCGPLGSVRVADTVTLPVPT